VHLLSHFSRESSAAQLAAFILRGSHASFLGTAALFFVLFGCGGASSSLVSSTTYTISGTITPSSDGSGATLTLSGPAAATTTAKSSGSYSFADLTNGTYVVAPSRSGYSFSPTQQIVTIDGADATGIDFSAAQQSSYSVSLSWQDSDPNISGYNVYRGTTDGGPYSRINSTLIGTPSYIDTSVASGVTYYYVTTAVNTAGESAYSNQATATIP